MEVQKIGIVFLGILIVAVSLILLSSKEDQKIDSFKECVEAGNPIMESYPRRCKTNGETYTEEHCESANGSILTLANAREIAKNSECGDRLKKSYKCNEKAFWIDLNITKEGCDPACVVNIETREARINWRCTGFNPD